MSATSETIIDKVEQSYRQILALYQNLPPADLTSRCLPHGRSLKDVLAQIAAWEWPCASLLKAARETNGPLQAKPDTDGLNREIYQERCHWSWPQVELAAYQAHQALLRAIRQMPAQRLADPTVQEVIGRESWEHYLSHLQLFGRVSPVTALILKAA